VRVTYYGQACTLLEAGGRKILTDPWLTEGAYLGTWFHTHLLADAGVTPDTFPKDIDYLFLSHEHLDHTDPETLKKFPANIPILVCKFATTKFRSFLQHLGFTNVHELASGEKEELGDGLAVTILNTVEYTNDSAILVEHDGVRLLNETDCKLGYEDLARIGANGLDIGFYMFSGANWYPMLYDYPEDVMLDLVQRRRRSLLRSLVQRVKLTKPKVAVPAAGPCTVLDSDLFWLNSKERGIFIDPEDAVSAIAEANLGTHPLYMRATDTWDSSAGYQQNSPLSFRSSRAEYIRKASERMIPMIAEKRAAEPAAHENLANLLPVYFNTLAASQTAAARKRISAKLALAVSGTRGGDWTLDLTAPGPEFVREGISPDWTYKIEVEDKLISPFVTGEERFFEDLLLSFRFRPYRRPDEFNEPLYHFLYEPDPEKFHNWYAAR
jgi:UDP-MurNAc hydroxylase